MKIFQKYLYILAFTLVLFGVAVCSTPKADVPLPRFLVQSPETGDTQEITIYNDEKGNYSVFLPSYANLPEVTILQPWSHAFAVDDTLLYDGMRCDNFQLDTPYDFSKDGRNVATLHFYQSANVATMYVDTVSGNMKYLHQDKDHKETAAVSLYTPEGKLDYFSDTTSLTGRGNATWDYDKRPYSMTLPADASLLEMAPATKWILLANAGDETNLNNKLILDLAKDVGLQWTPECRWVDLYLNGEYSGLYLLAEKVEAHSNRLPIDADSGDFLCRIDLSGRWQSLNSPFYSASGRTVEIAYPKYPESDQLAAIESLVAQMEEEFASDADLRNSSLIDLDSWVRKYLIDEISANIDSDLASSYFYFSDGKLFAGPIWDYDMTLGNSPRNHDPYAFIAKNYRKSRSKASKYYRALYSNASFYDRMVELYQTEFLPELQQMQDSEINRMISFIEDASRCNSIRWRSMYDNLPADVVHTPDALKEYFSRRVEFLNSAWLDNTVYCTLQFEPSYQGSSYLNISVEQGHCMESSYINTESVVWVDSETGEAFDFSQPVMKDMIFWKQDTES